MVAITQEKCVYSFISIVVPSKNQNDKFKMSEILKQKLILKVMKIWGQSATKLSGKPRKENTTNIITQRICI